MYKYVFYSKCTTINYKYSFTPIYYQHDIHRIFWIPRLLSWTNPTLIPWLRRGKKTTSYWSDSFYPDVDPVKHLLQNIVRLQRLLSLDLSLALSLSLYLSLFH